MPVCGRPPCRVNAHRSVDKLRMRNRVANGGRSHTQSLEEFYVPFAVIIIIYFTFTPGYRALCLRERGMCNISFVDGFVFLQLIYCSVDEISNTQTRFTYLDLSEEPSIG